MKILLYYDISLFAEKINETFSLQLIKDHLCNWLAKNLVNKKDIELKFIIPEIADYQNTSSQWAGTLDNLDTIVIKDEEFLEVFESGLSHEEIRKKIFLNKLSSQEEDNFIKYMKSKLGIWRPDIIITFPTHNNYLKKIYPEALVLYSENAIFSSRPPFMRTLKFDPFEYIDSFNNKFKSEIRNFNLTIEQNKKVEKFRKEIINIIEQHNPYKDILEELKNKYKYLVLLPIITDNLYEESYSNDEYVYLLDVIKCIPSDIGVIITKHDFTKGKINSAVLNFLQQKYPNIIAINFSKYNAFGANSLHFYNHVDAVINCMTGTGLLATLWNTRVIANDKLYSHWFCDDEGLDNLEQKLLQPIKSKNNMLYWYFTHYAVFQKNFDEPNWYYNFFKSKLESYRNNGITFELYEQVNDFDDIASYIIEHVKEYYDAQKPIPVKTHVTLNILGIKISFRKRNIKNCLNKIFVKNQNDIED